MNHNLRSLYNQLVAPRHEWVERGVRSAVLTIPSIFPREGQHRHRLPQNYQSIGARGVNNLTSKLNLTLFPPTDPFMRLNIPEAERASIVSQYGEGDGGTILQEADQSLRAIEANALSRFDQAGWRPAVAEAMRLLVVTGNALIYDRPGGRPATYNLHNYVVSRDADGTLELVILKQKMTKVSAIAQLGEEAVATIDRMRREDDDYDAYSEEYEVYTGALREDGDNFKFWEEVEGIPVGAPTDVPLRRLPLLPLRFQEEPTCSYGRGFIEDYDGHLLNLEKVSRSLSEGAQSMAKTIWLVKPNSMTKPQVLAKANNLAILSGDPGDVGTIRADKGADLGFALNYRNTLTMELQGAFLLNSSIQRSGERVTAEEIRLMAQELEDGLGGVYTSLADTVQAPIVFYLFEKMKSMGDIELPKEIVPVIATGLEAISRNHRASRIHQMFLTAQQIAGPQQVGEVTNVRGVMLDLCTAMNLDADRYILSEQEIQERQQQLMQQQLGEQAAGPMIQAALQQGAEAPPE